MYICGIASLDVQSPAKGGHKYLTCHGQNSETLPAKTVQMTTLCKMSRANLKPNENYDLSSATTYSYRIIHTRSVCSSGDETGSRFHYITETMLCLFLLHYRLGTAFK